MTFLAERWVGLAQAVVVALAGAYLSMLAMGALTMATEWHRIRAAKREKIRSVFTFPLFLFSYAPIAVTAVFRKYEWKPIVHTCAISSAQLQER